MGPQQPHGPLVRGGLPLSLQQQLGNCDIRENWSYRLQVNIIQCPKAPLVMKQFLPPIFFPLHFSSFFFSTFFSTLGNFWIVRDPPCQIADSVKIGKPAKKPSTKVPCYTSYIQPYKHSTIYICAATSALAMVPIKI